MPRREFHPLEVSGFRVALWSHRYRLRALQDAEHYLPLEARTYIVPAVQLASKIAPWLFVAGVMLQLSTLAWVGIILFGSSTLFAFLTLWPTAESPFVQFAVCKTCAFPNLC